MYRCVIFGLFLSGCNICYPREEWVREHITGLHISNQVSAKFIDSADRMSPKVQFTDASFYAVDNVNAYGLLNSGDLIIKEKGTLLHEIVRNGDTILRFYPATSCGEIKDK